MHQRTTRTSIKGPGLYYSLLSTKGGGKICDLPAVLVVFLCPCTLKKLFGVRTHKKHKFNLRKNVCLDDEYD